jgi:hypothetical protein
MERGAWKTPVVIEMYGRPGMVFITGTLDAALMLIGGWPTKRTEAHMAAVLSCRNVLTGSAEPALARATFIEAAIEAGYRIEPETFLSDRWDLTMTLEEPHRPALGLAALIDKRAMEADRQAEPPDAEAAAGSTNEQGSRSSPSSQFPRPPGLGELIGKLVLLLGQIGLEIVWSLTSLFTVGLVRRTGRQAH